MKQYDIKINNKWDYIIDVYYTLNEFINDFKQYYPTKRDIKTHATDYDCTFNDIFHEFINYCLHRLNISKNDKITFHKYDDYIVIYKNNECYEYHFE